MRCPWCTTDNPEDARTCVRPGCGHDPSVSIASCACARCQRGDLVLLDDTVPPPPPAPPLIESRTVKGNAAEWVRRSRGLVPLRRTGSRD